MNSKNRVTGCRWLALGLGILSLSSANGAENAPKVDESQLKPSSENRVVQLPATKSTLDFKRGEVAQSRTPPPSPPLVARVRPDGSLSISHEPVSRDSRTERSGEPE